MMRMRMKLLYITFIDMDAPAKTGSAVRPKKMLAAFEALGADVTLLSGKNNNRPLRKAQARRFMAEIQQGSYDCCYIEPPSGPMFCNDDVKLIKKIHEADIPMGLFYRDAYWKYPEYYLTKDSRLSDKLKHRVIRVMQQRQWRVFADCCKVVYFPSQMMADGFACDNADILPPGSFDPHVESGDLQQPLRFIFVGGAAKNHGTFLTLDAFEQVNGNGVKCTLTYVCPKDQWEGLGLTARAQEDAAWLKVAHASGDDELAKHYAQADVAILAAPRTPYRDFAVPIKVFEYLSYLKPMLVTNCTETARIVSDNGIGWVVEDDCGAIAEKIAWLADNPEEIKVIKGAMQVARDNNLWEKRAEKVLLDLTGENAR